MFKFEHKKIKSLFKRDYDGTRLVYDELVEGSDWVANGEGVATVKYDGTCCLVRDGKLHKRYDRKLTNSAKRGKKEGSWEVSDFRPAPANWEPAEAEADPNTGHWPGWLPVSDAPEDRWHRQAFKPTLPNGTYELVGPKVQGNPYQLESHELWRHGSEMIEAPRSYEELKKWLEIHKIEGIVWHHPDGRLVKIKRKDFGYKWPDEKTVADAAKSG